MKSALLLAVVAVAIGLSKPVLGHGDVALLPIDISMLTPLNGGKIWKIPIATSMTIEPCQDQRSRVQSIP